MQRQWFEKLGLFNCNVNVVDVKEPHCAKKIQEICVARTPPPAPPQKNEDLSPFSFGCLGFSEGASMTRHGHAHQPLLMSQNASPTPLTGW